MPRMPYRLSIYTTGDKHHAAQNLDNELGSITDADQVIGHANQIQNHDGAEGESQGPNIVLDFGQHLRMPHNHIDPQQQGYGENTTGLNAMPPNRGTAQ